MFGRKFINLLIILAFKARYVYMHDLTISGV